MRIEIDFTKVTADSKSHQWDNGREGDQITWPGTFLQDMKTASTMWMDAITTQGPEAVGGCSLPNRKPALEELSLRRLICKTWRIHSKGECDTQLRTHIIAVKTLKHHKVNWFSSDWWIRETIPYVEDIAKVTGTERVASNWGSTLYEKCHSV